MNVGESVGDGFYLAMTERRDLSRAAKVMISKRE